MIRPGFRAGKVQIKKINSQKKFKYTFYKANKRAERRVL